MREALYLMLRRLNSNNSIARLTYISSTDEIIHVLTNTSFFYQSIRIEERHIPGYIMKVKRSSLLSKESF